MLIAHTPPFVFVHIHKTAGESVAASLVSDLSPEQIDVREGPRHASTGQPLLTKHSTAVEARDYLGADAWQGYFTFSIVRHPVDRALSLYRYIEAQARPPHKPWSRLIDRTRGRGRRADRERPALTWPEVRAYLDSGSVSDFFRHPLLADAPGMRTQSSSLCEENGHLIVDFVGRYETLAADISHVRQHLGLPDRPLPWRNPSARTGIQPGDLSPEDRSYLADRYDEDFRRFDYHP